MDTAQERIHRFVGCFKLNFSRSLASSWGKRKAVDLKAKFSKEKEKGFLRISKAAFYISRTKALRTSLAVQWLRLCTSNAGGMGSIPGQGTKIPHAAWCSQKKLKIKNKAAEKIKNSQVKKKRTKALRKGHRIGHSV